jgi:hypothetical protein
MKNCKSQSKNNFKKPYVRNLIDDIIFSIKYLNIDKLESQLHDNRTYQNFTKKCFIQLLNNVFDEFRSADYMKLEVSKGFCNEIMCNNRCNGYRFSSKSSGLYFDLIIEIENGEVTDIYECGNFMCLSFDSNAIKRVRIDKRDFKIKIEKPPQGLFNAENKFEK